ncbi:MAG: RNA-binding transcriptional accessory protein [Desulfarculaceae bacterium]|nr:RNA-binding transcriptional accessory protein [Desulfarculaceae bacterium]MCF8071557.1 RNA-binding transcriptional accessory protein [Desulfarculaceae bacterium]MCF8102372.1 RNA-binding transcriptional accessory protein [Desulfarculaceae bacterium]MCF8114836.1 RNA-binding transcriptional accessory protein [Desulfarculaceae bacterium]
MAPACPGCLLSWPQQAINPGLRGGVFDRPALWRRPLSEAQPASAANLSQISSELAISLPQVSAVANLLEEGNTVPFIARYRKEATGSLDEVAIIAIRDRLTQLKELDARRGAILKSLTERNLLTPELEAKVEGAASMAELEDVYLPFKPKRRTKAMMAREKGLEPLALWVLAQPEQDDPAGEAAKYLDAEKGVESVEDALAGARDIIAEIINEDAEARAAMRSLYAEKAVLRSRVVLGEEEKGQKFKDYFEWSELAAKAAGHRILAIRRGEKEGCLIFRVEPEAEQALAILERMFLQNEGPCAEQVRLAVADSYGRLLGRAMEIELRTALRKRAEEEAVKVFAENLRELLMAAPLGPKRVLAIDPGFRTGCKVACLNRQGDLKHHDLINLMSENQRKAAGDKLRRLVKEHGIEAIAIGNGTASRESEALVRGLELEGVTVVMVSESGASVYSASEVAREEFPDLDLTVRGAVSIGRRLVDPLAELVKIDPKAIGVGQYQHDVDQGSLARSLEDVVFSCVNAVGVEVNTASPQLLAFVSGLGPSLAQNIVRHREANGPFGDRKQLLKVPRLGPKAFEQAAGFLRIRQGGNPLDASAVHPESYPVVEKMARDLACQLEEMLKDQELRRRIKPQEYVSERVGLPTVTDILAELDKPGRDPRQAFEAFSFAEGVHAPEDLQVGMRLPGVVTNVTNFGAFVDVGVHNDGLVHISQLADRFVQDPRQEVKVQQQVEVTVIGLDLARGRISLSMKKDPFAEPPRRDGGGRAPAAKPHKGGQGKGRSQPQPFNNAFSKALGKLNKN